MDHRTFSGLIWQKGRELYRDMPWRQTTDPYHILVSEMMLQQTQVDRVVSKYEAFIEHFPDIQSLASATLGEVLRLWSGLGYNRRALYLHQAAQKVAALYDGQLPRTIDELVLLPGVGKNTAGAIMCYAYNLPQPFIETNVRTVYFHHFFPDTDQVYDKEIFALVAETLDREHPREWFWALMDYGSFLKQQGSGRLDTSRHYKKQSLLKGSDREARGEVIRQLMSGPVTHAALQKAVAMDDRFERALDSLERDGLIIRQNGYVSLP